MERLRQEVRRLAAAAAQPRGAAPKTGQDRSTGRQGHHPRQSETRQRAHRDQTSRPPSQAQAGRHLRRQHVDALLLRVDAEPDLRDAGSDQQDPRLCLHRPPGVHLARLSGATSRKRRWTRCCAGCRPATTAPIWATAWRILPGAIWTRSTVAPPSSWWATGATTITTRASTCFAPSPGAATARCGSTRSRRTCGAPATATCSQYAPHCDVILQVSNLAELTTAVDKLLS